VECRTAVVGGGVAGLSLAMNLALLQGRGEDICVFEARYLGYGSSLRNAGRYRVHFGDERNLEFAIESAKYLRELSRITGMNTLFARAGYLWIASDEASYRVLRESNALFSRWKVPLEEMPPEELYRRFPFLRRREEIIAGFFGKEDGSIHPDAVIFGLERKSKKLGVKIFERSPVDGIEIEGDKVAYLSVSGSKVKVERAVLANGAWLGELSEKLGLGIPLEPVRKEIAVTEAFAFRIVPFVVDSSLHMYFSQTLKGEIIGSTSLGTEPKGTVDLGNTFTWMRSFARRLSRALVGGSLVRIMRVWSGYYEMTPDRSHIIGRSEEWPEGLYALGGFSGHGFMLGPLAGKLLAEHLHTGKVSRLMAPYSPDRFREGKELRETFVIG